MESEDVDHEDEDDDDPELAAWKASKGKAAPKREASSPAQEEITKQIEAALVMAHRLQGEGRLEDVRVARPLLWSSSCVPRAAPPPPPPQARWIRTCCDDATCLFVSFQRGNCCVHAERPCAWSSSHPQ